MITPTSHPKNSSFIHQLPSKKKGKTPNKDGKELRQQLQHIYPLLQSHKFTIFFPKGYVLVLNIPEQIKLMELTRIMRSYRKLHQLYGESDPLYLSSVDGDRVINGFLCSMLDEEMSVLKSVRQFKIEYGSNEADIQSQINCKDCNFTKENKKQVTNQCKIQQIPLSFLYKIQGKLLPCSFASPLQRQVVNITRYLVRKRTDKLLYTLTKIQKNTNLSYQKFTQIVSMRDRVIEENYQIRNGKTLIKVFPEIHQTFQTEKYLNIVQQFFPVNLGEIYFTQRNVIDHFLCEVAKILNKLEKQGYQMDRISCRNLVVSLKGEICYEEYLRLEKKPYKRQLILINDESEGNKNTQHTQFNSCLTKIFGQIMKNSDIKMVQYYFPLNEWLKRGKIRKYSDFLRYFSNKTTKNPNNYPNCSSIYSSSSTLHQQKKLHRQILLTILSKRYLLQPLQEQQEEIWHYQPMKSYFKYMKNTTPARQNDKVIENTSKSLKRCMQYETQNYTTVKKPKQEHKKCILGELFRERKNRKISKTKAKITNHRRHVSQFVTSD